MKKYLPAFTSKVHLWNLFIGLVIGSAVATTFVSAIAPDRDEVLALCRMDQKSQDEDAEKRHGWLLYSMNNITDQKSYGNQLVVHHELEISMSKRALQLNLSPEMKKIAEDVIARETKEIETIKGILSKQK